MSWFYRPGPVRVVCDLHGGISSGSSHRRLSDSKPSFKETLTQVVKGLETFSVLSHPRELWSMLFYGLPRHGLTPASAILGAGVTWGDRIALTDGKGSVTYRQLAGATMHLAAGLAEVYGIGAGTRVGLMAEDDRFLMISLGALGLCGASTWLLNPRMGTDDLAACLKEDRIDVVIHAPRCTSRLGGFSGIKISTDSLVELSGTIPTSVTEHEPRNLRIQRSLSTTRYRGFVPLKARHSRFVMLTGGTTSVPHAIPIRRRWLAPIPALALAGATGVRHGSPALICAPLFHGYGLACAMLCLVAGAPMVLSSVCDPHDMAQLNKGENPTRVDWGEAIYVAAKHYQATTIFAVPAQLHSLATYLTQEGPDHGWDEKISSIMSGSDRLSPQIAKVFHERWGSVVTNYYGTTESGTVTMISGVEQMRNPLSVGRPVACSRVRIVDDSGSILPAGTEGRIQLFSPLESVGSQCGYVTSDLGWIDDQGYLYVTGRLGDKRRSGGEFLSLAQIESLLTGTDGVEWVRVSTVPDERYGQRVVAEVRAWV